MLERIKLLLLLFPEAFVLILSNRKLWPLIAAPFFINSIIALIFGFSLYEIISNIVENLAFLDFLEQYAIFQQILSILLKLFVIFLTIWVFGAIAMIVASPFNGLITEKILDDENIHEVKDYDGVNLVIFEISRSIEFEFLKFTLGLVVSLITLVVNLIPIIGSIFYIAINLSFSAIINVMDLTDSASSRLNYNFRQKIGWILKNKEVTLPFGIISAFLLSVPFVNFLFSSVATVAATKLFLRLTNQNNQ